MTRRQRCIIAGIGNEEGNGQVAVNIQQSTFEAVAEFLASQPTLEDIANYRASEAMDERVHALLEKNREDSLSAEEMEEMQQYLALSHLMTLVKAKAKQRLSE